MANDFKKFNPLEAKIKRILWNHTEESCRKKKCKSCGEHIDKSTKEILKLL